MSLRFPFFFVRVRGKSMMPERVHGKRYFGTTLLSPKIGHTVLARTGATGLVIKQIAEQKEDDFLLKGLSPSSSSFVVRAEDILGVIF